MAHAALQRALKGKPQPRVDGLATDQRCFVARRDSTHLRVPGGWARFTSRSMNRYKLSTFSRAQGVLRRTFRLDPMLGSLLKQRNGMCCARPAKP